MSKIVGLLQCFSFVRSFEIPDQNARVVSLIPRIVLEEREREKEKYRSSHSNCVISLGQPRLYSSVVVAAAQWEANDAGRSKRALMFPDSRHS